MKPETRFRINRIDPFLKYLEKEYKISYDAIQQVAKVGSPDYYLCIRGIFVALEAKTDIGSVMPTQRLRATKIIRSGGFYLVARPKNWVQIQHLLVKLATGDIYDQSDLPTNLEFPIPKRYAQALKRPD